MVGGMCELWGMARKSIRIQAGGMCRVPSSRLVGGGMASESLNLASVAGETVPVLPPSLVEGDDIPPSWGEDNGELVFVHVQPTYEHHIFLRGSSLAVYGGGRWTSFLTVGSATLNGIVGVGNTLVVSTSEATHYVLWKDGSYRDLGTGLPKPSVLFVGDERDSRGVFVAGAETHGSVSAAKEVFDALGNDVWMGDPLVTSYVPDKDSTEECCDHGFCVFGSKKYEEVKKDGDVDETATDNARREAMWEAYADAVAYVARYNGMTWVNGRAFYQPHLFRYALRLYDGTYAMQSVPILVGGGITWPQLIGDATLRSQHGEGAGTYGFAMVPMYSVRAVMAEAVPDDWADIVTAVDIFCSSPINPYDPGEASVSRNGDPVYMTRLPDGFDNGLDVNMNWITADDDYITVERYAPTDDQIGARITNYNVFYRIGSFLVDDGGFPFNEDYDPAQEFTANQSDLVAGIRLKRPDADTLVTHTSTASTDWDDYRADSGNHGNAQRVMNQRLAIWDIDETLGGGLPSPNGLSLIPAPSLNGDGDRCEPESPGSHIYRICWVIDDNGDERFVWSRGVWGVTAREWAWTSDEHGELNLWPLLDTAASGDTEEGLGLLSGHPVASEPFAWLAYPDARCVRAVIRRMDIAYFDRGRLVTLNDWSDVMTVEMKEHPFLNCAYAWLGFAKPLTGGTASDADKGRFTEYYEDSTVRDTNTIMLSGAGDPFTFPAAGRYTFDYAVVSCATANMPLSTGQFGQFPLYVFTKGGIWAMTMNADGTFASSSPFSRDVAVSHRGVCEIDQGIVFITSKAVMAVQGGQTADLSALMEGRHDPLPESAVVALDGTGFGDAVPVSALEGAWTDKSALMGFMLDATAGYDYIGDRMIFVNGSYDWQWVWMRKDATWHRTMLWEGDWPDAEYGYNPPGVVRVKSLVNAWPGLMANLEGKNLTESEGRLSALAEMTSQLDRTRDESLASTGLYVSRPLTFDNPDVFKSVMDLRIRGDLKRGNARHLLMSSNNGHDWVLRRSLRGPSFRFHRIAVVTRMTTQERLSYIEMEYDERFANRLR